MQLKDGDTSSEADCGCHVPPDRRISIAWRISILWHVPYYTSQKHGPVDGPQTSSVSASKALVL